MKKMLTTRGTVTVDMLRKDRSLRPEIIGVIHGDLRGDVSGLRGDATNLRGDVSGLCGDATNLRGDVDDCELTPEERSKGVCIAELLVVD